MAAKILFVVCASLALVNTIAACPCGSWPSAAIGGCGLNAGYNNVAVDNGGCLDVISTSPIAPTGITIVSENYIDGVLEVVGVAPLLAAVGFEGTLPTAGSAGTSYSCGSGNVGISGESLAAAGLGAGAGLAGYDLGANAALVNAGANAALANAALGNAAWVNAGIANNLAGVGCGCGGIYY